MNFMRSILNSITLVFERKHVSTAIDKVSSDSTVIGYDLLSSLAYMSVLAIGGLPRSQILEGTAKQPFQVSVFFEYVFILAKRIGFEYTLAFEMVANRAKAGNVKSLLLRFSAAISSGESERDFIIQESTLERDRYKNDYERAVENLRKWTDAYGAILVSVTLIMVVSLVSSLMGSLTETFTILMAAVLFFITSMGAYVINGVAPKENITYDTKYGITRERMLAKRFLKFGVPAGLITAFIIAPTYSLLPGTAIVFACLGVSLIPTAYFQMVDHNKISKLDEEMPTFIRTIGNIAGSTGVTLSEALKRIDIASMGTLGYYIERLSIRLKAQIPTDKCWEKFRIETGSELVNRSTHMLVDGAERGGTPDDVGNLTSEFCNTIVQLRATRELTSATFLYLTIVMHAVMAFILVFVLAILTSFNNELVAVHAESMGEATSEASLTVPDNLSLPPGIALSAGGGSMPNPIDMFGSPDMRVTSATIMFVIFILTFANSLAPKFASGGNNLKIAGLLCIMCLVSATVITIVPMLADQIFTIQ
jgi:flagellar protein FlaJ